MAESTVPGRGATKHEKIAGTGGPSLEMRPGIGTYGTLPPLTLPPSEVTYQSQSPPARLPPTIVLRRMTDSLALGGTSGAKSDSTTPMPPPTRAELFQIVTFENFRSPSASWNTPPPLIAELLPEIVVFSMRASPSALLQNPPPSPPSRRRPASSMPGMRAVLPMMLVPQDVQVGVRRVGKTTAVGGEVPLDGRVDDRELVARRVVDPAAVEGHPVVLDKDARKGDAHAAVLDAAAIGSRDVAADGAVGDVEWSKVVDADSATLFGGEVAFEGRADDVDRATLGVEAAAAGDVAGSSRRWGNLGSRGLVHHPASGARAHRHGSAGTRNL